MLKYLRQFWIDRFKQLSFRNFNLMQKNLNNSMYFSTIDKEIDIKTSDPPIDNDNQDDKLDLDFTDKQLHLEDFSKIIPDLKCNGCGTLLQTENKNKLGYIPEKKLKESLTGDKENLGNYIENVMIKPDNIEPLKEFTLIYDKATINKLKKLGRSKHKIICERCYKLANYLNFEDLNQKNKTYDTKDKEKADNYTLLVKKINPERLIHQIMARISNKAHIFYICDITDLEATINKTILKEIARKGIGLTFIINKYDVLPTKVIEERIKVWVGENLKDLTKDVEV